MNFVAPLFASGALRFAFEKATIEGKITIGVLIVVSIFSWTVIISKARQLYRARKIGKKFFIAYRATRYPLENNPGQITRFQSIVPGISTQAQTDVIARAITTKISHASFESVRVAWS